MRIDVVSIFPDYLAPLSLSLPGKAQEAGSSTCRSTTCATGPTTGTARSTTPYGGGAGMVMKPEPWGEALDALTAEGEPPVVVVPTPSGSRSPRRWPPSSRRGRGCCSPAAATKASTSASWTTPAPRWDVREVSIGDYVLNGGEVAALVVVEAAVRLLPGFMGNPESLAEESHGDAGLLEYPALHQAADLARSRGARGAVLRPPRPGRAVAAGRGAPAYGARRPDLVDRLPEGARRATGGPRRFLGGLTPVAESSPTPLRRGHSFPVGRAGRPPATGALRTSLGNGSPEHITRFRG